MDRKFPIGKLQVPAQVTDQDVAKWLMDIQSFTQRLRETVGSLSELELNKTYRDGSWNVRQLVHHIADSQLNMYVRLKLALTDQNPTVPEFNQDQWAILPDTELPVESSIKMLEGLNERIVFLGSRLTTEERSRTFTLQDIGVISITTKLAKLNWHEEHHFAHIKLALSND